ncbi:unnamed protein product [Phaedon cochleariae]|uniref:Uncharacterized protein n=1 Tax=Phaedon cochleariae TaxID=80249 RepID=A0A9N9X032_PHACE|nr:unnamed protein product [Phaedon cochleariae]
MSEQYFGSNNIAGDLFIEACLVKMTLANFLVSMNVRLVPISYGSRNPQRQIARSSPCVMATDLTIYRPSVDKVGFQPPYGGLDNGMAYALSPAGPAYLGAGASPTQAPAAEPFAAADSPYFPFNAAARGPGSRLSPAKAKVVVRTKEEPAGGAGSGAAGTTLDGQWGGVYGSDEFAHESPRYTSPGAGAGYYIGPEGGGGGPSPAGGEWPPHAYPYQTYEAYGLIPEVEPGQGLPPMSSLRPGGTPTTTTANAAAATMLGAPPFVAAGHQDGVAVNKGLAGIYPAAEQASASSYSSAPSTPVSSPPPIAPTGWLTNHSTPHSPHYTQAVTVNNTVAPQGLHMVSTGALPVDYVASGCE